MPSFHTSRRVTHSAADMFALVADVEQYPKFVPLCKNMHVLRREHAEQNETVIARMTVAYKLFTESFTSRVVLKPGVRTIHVDYLDGPFRRLENRWTFKPLNDVESQIGFYLDYELKSMPLQMLMGAVFDRAFRTFADAFEARAHEIYGRRAAIAPCAARTPVIPEDINAEPCGAIPAKAGAQ
ncbi:MAG: type II toxin-antitoxin system RatA family toxin [Rhodomicrobium sp.]|nr:type II toxin-antitoxin system RatA family toxin [Rhodomicrobium sp.]